MKLKQGHTLLQRAVRDALEVPYKGCDATFQLSRNWESSHSPHQLHLSILSWTTTITNEAQTQARSHTYRYTQGCQWYRKFDEKVQTSSSCHDAMVQSRYLQRFESSKLYQSIFSWIKAIIDEAPTRSYISAQAQVYQRCFRVMHEVMQHFNCKIALQLIPIEHNTTIFDHKFSLITSFTSKVWS